MSDHHNEIVQLNNFSFHLIRGNFNIKIVHCVDHWDMNWNLDNLNVTCFRIFKLSFQCLLVTMLHVILYSIIQFITFKGLKLNDS